MQSAIGKHQDVTRDVSTSGLHTAVVYAPDGVRLVAAAPSRRALIRRIADYVERHANETLWPNDTRLVHQLLAEAAHEQAVELYFALVGERWDEEWIVFGGPHVS
jgi:hypothetical protein